MDNQADVNKHVDKVPMQLPARWAHLPKAVAQWIFFCCFFLCVFRFNYSARLRKIKHKNELMRQRQQQSCSCTWKRNRTPKYNRKSSARTPDCPPRADSLPHRLPLTLGSAMPDWHAQRHSMSCTINFHNCPASVSRWYRWARQGAGGRGRVSRGREYGSIMLSKSGVALDGYCMRVLYARIKLLKATTTTSTATLKPPSRLGEWPMGQKLKCLSVKFQPEEGRQGTWQADWVCELCVCVRLFNFQWKLSKARMKWKLL